MSKKTLILSQEQLDEICGGDSSYLDGLANKPDMGSVFTKEVSSDGGIDGGYAKPTTTDDVADDLTNDWRGNAKLHGMGPIIVREMSVKDWKREYLGEENERLKNMKFGAGDGEAGKGYEASKVNFHRLHKAQDAMLTGSTEEAKQKAARTVSRMKDNWPGIDRAEKQYNSAKYIDKSNQANKMPGTKIKKNNMGIPGDAGVFLNQ